jgi:hypothetical protein
MDFDEAKVTVNLGGNTRTYNIEQPATGHPMTMRLDIGYGKPSDEAIFEALRGALGSVGA